MQTTTYVSPAEHMLEAFASSSWSVWATSHMESPRSYKGSPWGHLRKNCWTLVSHMLVPWLAIQPHRRCFSIPLGVRTDRMSVDALGISSFELNDAKHVGGIGGDNSNPCFKKPMGEHHHPVPAKVSRSWRSKESLPKGPMLSL